jgi:hypothetical protein
MGERNRSPGVCAKEVAAIRASLADLRRDSNAFKVEVGELRAQSRRAVRESRALMLGCDDLLTCQVGEPRRAGLALSRH